MAGQSGPFRLLVPYPRSFLIVIRHHLGLSLPPLDCPRGVLSIRISAAYSLRVFLMKFQEGEDNFPT